MVQGVLLQADVNGTDGAGVPGLLGSSQTFGVQCTGVGKAVVTHLKYVGTDTGAQAAANAVFVDSCFHAFDLLGKNHLVGNGSMAQGRAFQTVFLALGRQVAYNGEKHPGRYRHAHHRT